jgi:phosphoribosylaminoimidazole-succinocarboxamide synthase
MDAVKETNFEFPSQTGFYRGKVRDVYYFGDKMAMVASDRISAFDFILPRPIPYKGQVLNQIAARNLKETSDIVPNWLEIIPDPNVSIGKKCVPIPIEMVIRGYLTGHAWREYRSGKRILCGVPMPEGMKEDDKFPEPIITPATKAEEGHDEDISREEIISQGIVEEKLYETLEEFTRKLYHRGCEVANEQDLILVDTKYEFGLYEGEVNIIDEIHTPDSSRYFYKDDYTIRQKAGEPQKHLSKEFTRQWLISQGFQGLPGQEMPEMSDDKVEEEILKPINERIEENILNWIRNQE